jgi:hypothetical protein
MQRTEPCGRRLHFGSHQIYWVCRQACEAEDGTNLRPVLPKWFKWSYSATRPVDDMGGGRSAIGGGWGPEKSSLWKEHASWATLVENYSSRSLTYAGDQLRALAAVAEMFGKLHPGSYVAGC